VTRPTAVPGLEQTVRRRSVPVLFTACVPQSRLEQTVRRRSVPVLFTACVPQSR